MVGSPSRRTSVTRKTALARRMSTWDSGSTIGTQTIRPGPLRPKPNLDCGGAARNAGGIAGNCAAIGGNPEGIDGQLRSNGGKRSVAHRSVVNRSVAHPEASAILSVNSGRLPLEAQCQEPGGRPAQG